MTPSLNQINQVALVTVGLPFSLIVQLKLFTSVLFPPNETTSPIVQSQVMTLP